MKPRSNNARSTRWGLWIVIAIILLAAPTVIRLAARSLLARPLNPAPSQPAVIDGDSGFILPEGVTPIAQNGTNSGGATPEAPPNIQVTPLNRSDRLTLLVMGLDRRSGESILTRTDTMLLVSFHPSKQTASVLSIPRDLYLEVPNYGKQRINTAFVLGAQDGGEAGGAALAMQTIEQNLGVFVDHYALLDFDAVIKMIDAVGGVPIRVFSTIDDPLYPDSNYGYDPLYLEPGSYNMDGELALKYMRTRHGDTDFGRAQRQQQVMLAFRDQLFNQDIASSLSTIVTIQREIQGGMFTDLTPNDILTLADATRSEAAYRVRTEVLDERYVSYFTTEQGASVLQLKIEEAVPLLNEMFDAGDPSLR